VKQPKILQKMQKKVMIFDKNAFFLRFFSQKLEFLKKKM